VSDLQAQAAESRETDMILKAEGYPIARYWTNDAIESWFGQCSKQHHRLLAIQQFHERQEDREEFLQQWKTAPKEPQGCRPYQSIETYVGPYSKSLEGSCYDCCEIFRINVLASRLIAISKLKYPQLWMAVLPRRDAPRSYVFEGSARCNGFGHEGRNHCMTPSHLNMETFKQNARRKEHHRGNTRCHCYHVCIGRQVRATTRASRQARFEPKTQKLSPFTVDRSGFFSSLARASML
jgi:hypothetical protein